MTAAARRVRVGLLSAAHVHADAYAAILRDDPGVDLLGISDEDPARGRAFARQHGISYLGGRDALLAAAPAAAVVTSANVDHRADVESLAASGIDVMCEKPLATTVPDAAAMVAACRDAGVLLMTAFPMRFSPPLRELKRTLDDGRLGPICSVVAVNQGQFPGRDRAWFADPRLAGGGAVMDHTVHVVDLLRWMLSREVTEVYALTNRILHAGRSRVETGGVLMLHFGDVVVTLDCSWSRPDTYPTWGGLGMEVIGDRGVIEVDAFRQRFTVHASDASHGTWSYWGTDPNRGMLHAFVEAVRGGREPPISSVDGLRAVEVVAAAYASAESGEAVSLDAPSP